MFTNTVREGASTASAGKAFLSLIVLGTQIFRTVLFILQAYKHSPDSSDSHTGMDRCNTKHGFQPRVTDSPVVWHAQPESDTDTEENER